MITVAGLTPSLDLTYTVEALRLGEIHRVPDVVRCAGGKALNMARAASTAGASCGVVAILGGLTGDLLVEMLKAEGLRVTVVGSPAETRTCVSIAAADTGRLTEVYQDAAAIPVEVWRSFRETIGALLEVSPGWLSISGRAPTDGAAGIADLVQLGRQAGVRVAVDTHGDALPSAIGAGPDLVKVNRYEAAELLDVDPDTELLVLARGVAERSGGMVVLTDGTAGALALDGDRALHAVAPGVPGRYPVGSGDSFLGGLLAALDRGDDLAAALRTATGCGVANAMTPGQGHFRRADATRIAAEVKLQTIG